MECSPEFWSKIIGEIAAAVGIIVIGAIVAYGLFVKD